MYAVCLHVVPCYLALSSHSMAHSCFFISFLLYVLFFEVINSILQQNLLASMFTESMACPLEASGRGLGEAHFIMCTLLCECGKSRSCGPTSVSLARSTWEESSASPTDIDGFF